MEAKGSVMTLAKRKIVNFDTVDKKKFTDKELSILEFKLMDMATYFETDSAKEFAAREIELKKEFAKQVFI